MNRKFNFRSSNQDSQKKVSFERQTQLETASRLLEEIHSKLNEYTFLYSII